MSITNVLVLTNVLVFLFQGVLGDTVVASFALWPIGRFDVPGLGTVGFDVWQLATSAFLHGNIAHLTLNMFALHMFGRDVERRLGPGRYLLLYAVAILSAALVQLAVVTAASSVYPTVGASGGVFGVLLAFGVMFPKRVVVLLFPPIPLPARLFVVLYGLLELAHGVFGTAQGVAHFAHLGGMLGAGLLLIRWRRREFTANGTAWREP